jgi:hypothetical protein
MVEFLAHVAGESWLAKGEAGLVSSQCIAQPWNQGYRAVETYLNQFDVGSPTQRVSYNTLAAGLLLAVPLCQGEMPSCPFHLLFLHCYATGGVHDISTGFASVVYGVYGREKELLLGVR